MKRKLFSGLMFLLVVCIALSMVVLSACNKTEEPEKPVDYSQDSSEMLADVIQKLQGSYNVGEQFGVDVSAAFLIDDKTEKNDDVKFTLTAKGNADFAKNAAASNTNAFIELAMTKANVKTTIIGIAYEVIDGEPYFFANVMGDSYVKVNGYSWTDIYAMLVPDANVSAGFDIGSIAPILANAVFGEKGEVKDNVYTFNFDLAQLMVSVNTLIKNPLIANVISSVGITTDQINAVIAQVFGNLSYTDGEKQVFVTDLNTLTEYVKREMSFEGKIALAFDANNKFASANLSFDYAKKGTPVANYTLAIDKAFVGTTTSAVDTFANFALDKDARKNNEAINILKFSFKGNVVGYDANGVENHYYNIIVNSDIEPFALLNLVGNTSKENIVAVLKELGYFHLEINETDKDGQKLEGLSNILTIHSKFDEGFAIVNVNAHNGKAAGLELPVALGGLYDFDALIDVIGKLANQPSDPGEEPGEPTDPKPVIDQIKDVIDTVKEYLAFFKADNMAENGVTVQLRALVNKVLGLLNVNPADETISGLLDSVLGSDVMNIKLSTPVYNSCDKVDSATVELGMRKDFAKNTKSYLKEIKTVDALQNVTVFKGDTNILRAAVEGSNNYYNVTGIDLNGEEVTYEAVLMAVEADTSKVGKTTATVYVGVNNDIRTTLAKANMIMTLDVDNLIPLGGVLKAEVEIEVVDKDIDKEITYEYTNTVAYSYVGQDVWNGAIRSKGMSKLYPRAIYDEKEFKFTMDDLATVTKDGKDFTAQVKKNGTFSEAGVYEMQFAIGDVQLPVITVNVLSVEMSGTIEKTEVTVGDKFTLPTIKIIGTDGQELTYELNVEYAGFLAGSYNRRDLSYVTDSVEEGGVTTYTVKYWSSVKNKDCAVVASVDVNGSTVYVPIGITIKMPATNPAA